MCYIDLSWFFYIESEILACFICYAVLILAKSRYCMIKGRNSHYFYIFKLCFDASKLYRKLEKYAIFTIFSTSVVPFSTFSNWITLYIYTCWESLAHSWKKMLRCLFSFFLFKTKNPDFIQNDAALWKHKHFIKKNLCCYWVVALWKQHYT